MYSFAIRCVCIMFCSAVLLPDGVLAQETTRTDLPRLPLPVSPLSYPVEALVANEEGTVVLTAIIGEDGQVSDARVDTSSGFPTLDEAALGIANEARLPTPPTNAAGEPVSVDVLVDINWELPLEPADEYLIQPEPLEGSGGTPPKLDRGHEVIRATDYPASAVRSGATGVVALEVRVTEQGVAEHVELLHSSGNDAIDRSAQNIAENRFRWTPGTLNDQPSAWRVPQIIDFILIPGTQSQECYAVPPVSDSGVVRITGVRISGPQSGIVPPSDIVSRWVHVNEHGNIDTALLETDDGWKKLDDEIVAALAEASEYESRVEDGRAIQCWYYRPLPLRAP